MSTIHDERMQRFADAGLYLVTSQALSAGRTTPEIVCAALSAGVSLFQLREKDLPLAELLPLAREVRALTAAAGAVLIINDRLDVAMAIGADGVHLGQDDFPIAEARKLAPDMVLGASTHNRAEARLAQDAGASYINIGPIFPTGTKDWVGDFLGLEGLKEIAPSAHVPFTVMGGIKKHHIPDVCAAGARTLAVVTAVTAAEDPAAASGELLALIRAARTARQTL